MNRVEPSFSFGIEEEYFVVDQESRDLAALPPQLLSLLKVSLRKRFSEEFSRAQIEINTRICASSLEAPIVYSFSAARWPSNTHAPSTAPRSPVGASALAKMSSRHSCRKAFRWPTRPGR